LNLQSDTTWDPRQIGSDNNTPSDNNPPEAVGESAVTIEDTSVSIDVLSNDTDPDNDTLSVASVTQPNNGTATRNPDNTVTYTPRANFNGADSFTYSASDGHGVLSTATVSVTVNPINDAPVATNQSVTTRSNTPVALTLQASDADGDLLTYLVGSQPKNGALSGGAPNLTYMPNSGFSGSDSLSFTANDGQAPSNLATISITVAPPGPIAADGFESGTFSGGTGWNASWTKSGDVTIRTNSDGPKEGIRHVRLRRSTGYLQRRVNLSGASNVYLTFWAKVRSFESSDKALVKFSPDGVTFTTVKTFTSTESNNTYRYYDLSLSGFPMTSNFQIAFDAEMSSDGDYWFLDDIEIVVK
jgi:hypothetical protein